VTGRQGRRRRKLLDDLKGRRGYSNLKEEALTRTMWRARLGRGFGPVVRQTTKLMNKLYVIGCKNIHTVLLKLYNPFYMNILYEIVCKNVHTFMKRILLANFC